MQKQSPITKGVYTSLYKLAFVIAAKSKHGEKFCQDSVL